ncbi:MAG TPA: outer membrane lipoprotein carrier protein LolA [Vicinamibacterales bacterium]|nr:outer membrane lipoprotein carrier protein LolA [Vicinamibacterales bacterium]
MKYVVGFVGFALLAATPAAQTPPAADQLARQLQARYDKVKDFTADFTQTFRGIALPQQTTERGQVKVKKPYRMRWTYTAPERKELIADSLQFWDFRPVDKVVIVRPMPKEGEASTALLFLAGRGNLTRDFAASLPPSHPDGEWHLKLVPKAPQADFTSLVVQVDRATMALRGLVKTDDTGVWTYRFLNLKENVGLPDKAFVFTPPAGVEIIR